MYLLGLIDHRRRRVHIAQAPPGNRVRLAQRVARDRALKGPGERIEVHVLVRRVDDVLVRFVGDDPRIVLFGVLQNRHQLIAREHFAAGVRRIADHNGLGTLRERLRQVVFVEAEAGRVQRHVNGLG
ncbi:MAG: hypothetical protein AN485_24605, partial [Anabaena sp. MDT14b]